MYRFVKIKEGNKHRKGDEFSTERAVEVTERKEEKVGREV